MNLHKIECGICHELFSPADLSEVFKHEHNGLSCETKVGVCVERIFTEAESVNIKRLRFDYAKGTVDVCFRRWEADYRYLDVPSNILVDFSNSDKPGAFLAQQIKGNFRFYHLNGD
jgi:hypothetical protein